MHSDSQEYFYKGKPWNYHFLTDPFVTSAPILYPLETLENQGLSGVFGGYKRKTLATNELITLCNTT